jgi:hypothetical protein
MAGVAPEPIRWLAAKKRLQVRQAADRDRTIIEPGGRTVALDHLIQHDGAWLRYGYGRGVLYWRPEKWETP